MKIRSSIASTALLHIGLGVLLLVAASTLVTFYLVFKSAEQNKLEELTSYIVARTQQENRIFTKIAALEAHAGDILRHHLENTQNNDAQIFDKLFPEKGDGTRRSLPGLFEGLSIDGSTYAHGLGAFIGRAEQLSADDKTLLLKAFNIVLSFGEGNLPSLPSFYFFTPRDQLIIFAPEREDRLLFYRQNAPGNFSFQGEEINQITLPQNNPARTMRCTTLQPILYDQSRQTFTTGCHTPVDINGVHVGAFGTSITLRELFDNFINDHLDDAYNMIITHDGKLIVHPTLLQTGSATAGLLDIATSGNEELRSIWRVISTADTSSPIVINDTEGGNIIATGRIGGPDWHFITVFPRQQISDAAAVIALEISLFALTVILVLLPVMWFLLRRGLATPLQTLATSAIKLRAANFSQTRDIIHDLPMHRLDEIGDLARSLGAMAEQLDTLITGLEKEVEKRTEDMRLAMGKAKQADASKSKLIGMVSHDIRSPLTVILGMTEMIRLSDQTPDTEKRLTAIERAANRLLGLANDILDFSRLDGNHVSLDIKPLDLQSLIDDLVAGMRIEAPAKGLTFNYEQNIETLPRVMGDAKRLAQVLSNILSNAIKYTNQGTIDFTVGAYAAEGRSLSHLNFRIKDSGPGIPEDRFETIFAPFSQDDTMDQNQRGGVGLGLSIVHDILRLMHGSVILESRVGEGSEFIVDIPLDHAPS